MLVDALIPWQINSTFDVFRGQNRRCCLRRDLSPDGYMHIYILIVKQKKEKKKEREQTGSNAPNLNIDYLRLSILQEKANQHLQSITMPPRNNVSSCCGSLLGNRDAYNLVVASGHKPISRSKCRATSFRALILVPYLMESGDELRLQ